MIFVIFKYSKLMRVIFIDEYELERYQTAKVTFKVTQGLWYWCHSIGYMYFKVVDKLSTNSYIPLHGPDTDTDFFAAKLRWVRVRVRVVEFSYNVAC